MCFNIFLLLYIKDEVNFLTHLNCLWCSFCQQTHLTNEWEKQQTTANKMRRVFSSHELK